MGGGNDGTTCPPPHQWFPGKLRFYSRVAYDDIACRVDAVSGLVTHVEREPKLAHAIETCVLCAFMGIYRSYSNGSRLSIDEEYELRATGDPVFPWKVKDMLGLADVLRHAEHPQTDKTDV